MVEKDRVDEIVEQWARERPDLETGPMALLGRISRTARLAGDAQERCYGRFGITRADFDVLATLRRAGGGSGLSPGRLTSSLMLTSGGMTGRLDRLERAGLVVRTPDPEDRRALLVDLTPAGRELIDEAVTASVAEQRRLLGDLTVDQQRKVSALLREVLGSVERHA
ncbi:MarR family winged helix-turn-helix transcriptional regulator [Blastococcus xanthinilyticus]|uniref:DNA-binding MarR family transcriptional regulator n=1 Tax=Blastococcus xanthinilyticus TaxID=1564164 RepID=A0A5S5CRP5_9ACTN|nr:MarR family transcriptional regulator [Blastococcus xanthinilyticus]TYP86265.1 DNA-binding MarR family transcriptional regulator [Blastococcus xanthinilyticus]